MADNVTLNSGSGGATLATDDVGGVQYQRVKATWGADGVANDVSNANPLPVSDGGGSITVDGSLTTVSTVSTITNVVHVDDNAGSLTVDGSVSITGTAAISAASLPLPTGAATAAKQPALGTAGTASADVITVQGIASMTALKVDASGVAVPITDNSGSLTVDNAGTFAVQAAQSGTWNITNVSGTVSLPTGASTAAKQPALGTAGTASADVITVQGIASMTALKVDGSAVTQPVSGTVTVQQSTASSLKVDLSGTSANTTAIKVDGSAVTQPVSLASVPSHNVTNAGTFAVQASNTGSTGSAVPSTACYDAGIAKTALPTAASDGNLTGLTVDKFGRQVVLPGTIRDLTGTQTTTISASTSETTIVTAAANVFNDLALLIVSNTSASTNTRIDFRDTTGGTVLFSLYSVGGQGPVGFSMGGMVIPQTSVNTNWTAQCATSTTDIRIYAVFAKNK